MSNSSGPSAEEVAKEVRRQQLAARLRVEDPVLSEKYESQHGVFSALTAIMGLGFIGVVMLSLSGENWAPIIIYTIIALAVSFLVPSGEDILKDFEQSTIKNDIERSNTIDKVGKMISEEEAIVVGDKIIAHPGATIINRSVVVDSYNTVLQGNPDLASALSTLAGYIEISKNKEAGEVFSDLAEEVKSGARPSRVRAFWNELIRVLPDIKELTSVVSAITKLFA